MTSLYHPLAARESAGGRAVFNHATRVTVEQYERHEEKRNVRSLYLRDPITRRVDRLPTADDRTSYQSPVASRDVPYAFFNVMRVSDSGRGSWLHVARLELRSRDISVLFSEDDLFAWTGVERKWRIGPWVSDLERASDDGRILTCKIGVPEPREDGGYRMNYALFDLDITTRRLDKVLDLAIPWE